MRVARTIAKCIALLALITAVVFLFEWAPFGEMRLDAAERQLSGVVAGREPTTPRAEISGSLRAFAEVRPADDTQAGLVDGIAGAQSPIPPQTRSAAQPHVGRSPEAEELLGYAAIDRPALAREISRPHTLEIPLGQGRIGRVILEKKTPFGGGENAWQWVGKLSGDPYSSVVLTAWKGTIFGTLYGAEGPLEFRQVDGSTVEIVRLDVSALPDCGAQDGDGIGGAVQTEHEPTSASASQAGLGTRYIDIVVGYNEQARVQRGGVATNSSDSAKIEVAILDAVARANLAYNNSDIDLVMRLAWLGKVDYFYPLTNTLSNALTQIANPTDGNADLLADKRAQYGADFACLWIDNTKEGGLANVLTTNSQRASAYSVVSSRAETVTFAHEVGHNMGCRHLRSDYTTPPSSWTPYAFAHYFTGSDGKIYATVMASYSNATNLGATRIPYFSSPSVSYLSTPTGVTNSEDCARTIRDNRAIYESFYPTPSLAAGMGESAGTLFVALANGFVQQNYQLWRSTDLRDASSWSLQGQFTTDNEGKITQPIVRTGLTNVFYQWRP